MSAKTPAANPSFQAFQFYPDWWLSNIHIVTASGMAESAIVHLFIRQWQSVTLPASPATLQRLTKASEREWKTIWPEIAPLFPLVDDGAGRRNPEQHALYLERVEFIKKQTENGGKGGRPRKPRESDGEPTAEATHNPLHNPNTNPRETQAKPTGFDRVTPPHNPLGNPLETSMSVSVSLSGSNSQEIPSSSSSLPGSVRTDDIQQRLLLTAAANRGIAERYGEQPVPILAQQGSTQATIAEWATAGVPFDFALRTLYGLATQLLLDKPPRSLGYFREAVTERWCAEQARTDAAAFAPPTTSASRELESADDMFRAMVLREARAGDATFQAYADEHGILFREAVA